MASSASSAGALSTGVLRIGTRRSRLAMAQAGLVADVLRAARLEVELVGVVTEGDRSARVGAPLAETGGTGVFVADLRSRLLAGEVDLAVHSLKDLPTQPAPGLAIAAIPRREDPRDALVARDGLRLAELPAGARVGTGAPRRAAQLRAARSDLDVQPLRGNVDTRLRKVADGALDAIVVAAAGLARLGRLGDASELLGADVMLPAPGQGALAVECRAADLDGTLRELPELLDDAETRAAVAAERSLLATLEVGCTAPVGALASVRPSQHLQQLELVAAVVSVDGQTVLRRHATGPTTQPEALGRRLAAELIAAGAGQVIGEQP